VLIADVPPPRDSLALSRLSVSRLGKDVIDLLAVSVSYSDRNVLRDVEWRIAPGERTAILGRNGAGKSTLLAVIAGTLAPTGGRVKTGKTVKVGVLDQRFAGLDDIAGDRVREVLARFKISYVVDGKELTPAQLLERLGFSREHLSARVADLSGGQKRRLQLLLVLLAEPNVMILDEPSNDVDVDMLAAMEDLLDSWPGTLIVVSHDRYFVERVTDQQYALIDGRLRHVPGGIDEYLRLDAVVGGVGAVAAPAASASASASAPVRTAAAERATRKELAAAERKLDRLAERVAKIHARMASHDPADYAGILALTEELREAGAEVAATETRWLELSDQLD
jgi:ATPase subunit of ABC transporter with duplicated ATPase domains